MLVINFFRHVGDIPRCSRPDVVLEEISFLRHTVLDFSKTASAWLQKAQFGSKIVILEVFVEQGFGTEFLHEIL